MSCGCPALRFGYPGQSDSYQQLVCPK
ncbi:hypothetical protein FGIG_12614 [Fasciola gigantica]|uniref:Uncharacterized protein n=1 Tax=Fasciola gigantica TaxID=46835 RepID=A0A504Y5H4_FASGI|nr:hypothetical protein FGIG_12614 [Fasciola gigantica]